MRIGFVFTNFNNSKFTREAIHSISINDYAGDIVIVVIDNNSDLNEVELLKEIKLDYPYIHLILNIENFGYFKGLNIGLNYLKKNYETIDYIIIGNNDLVFHPGFIKSVYAYNLIFERFPIVSPDLVTLDGVHQNPHVIIEISKFRELIFDMYYSSYILASFINQIAKVTRRITDRKDEKQFNVAQTIYQGYGACYILGKVFFKNFDQLWAPTFLMGEEFFLSKQLESKQMKIYYEPGITVRHQEHASVSKLPKKKLWELAKESHKIYRKYVKTWN